MRIANTTIVRNYTHSLNKNLANVNKANFKVTSGRRFTSMAEDTSAGVRAMQVRRNLSRIETYENNVQTTASFMQAAEDSMRKVSDLGIDISGKYTTALNATTGVDEREIFANELERLQEQILTIANGQFADRNMYGGTNADPQTPPFTLDAGKNLMYNDKLVKDILPTDPLALDAAYVDVGLGMNFDPNAITGDTINPNSGVKNTLVGLDFLGYGENNIYLVVGELIDSLKSPSFDAAAGGKLLDKVKDSTKGVNLAITKMGADSAYLEFTTDRLETEKMNLTTRQQQLEIVDPAEAILEFQMQQYVYNAALQMGQKLLQPTLFSFIN